MYQRDVPPVLGYAIKDASAINPWPSNVLRHSYGSYFLASAKDTALTDYNMGNTVNVINGHYRKPVSAEATAEFLSIMPAVQTGVVVMPHASTD